MSLAEAAAPARPVTPVAILAASLSRISERLDEVGGVPEDLRAELRTAALLAGGLDDYVGACTTPESPALAGLAQRTASHDWGSGALEQEMLSGHVEGQLLQFLVHATGARRVLEIGMFTGYSALAMAEALPAHGRVVACELDAEVAAFAAACFVESPAGTRITVEVGPALDTLARLAEAGEVFDLVFIDADKAGYAAYVDAVLGPDSGPHAGQGLLAPGGLVAVDNTLMQGQPWLPGEPSVNGAAIADFNALLAQDSRVVQVLLPVRDGLTLVRRAHRS